MTAEEAAMIMMSGGKSAVIKPLTVTKNGTYEKLAGTDGYSPVYVTVPDRYEEGYQDGYTQGYSDGYTDGEEAVKAKIQSKTITANGTYSAATDGLDGFDPVIVNVPDRYEEGYIDGQKNGEYIFPDGTEYPDIIKISGGDTVTDHTTGYGFKVVVEDSGDRRKMSMCVVDAKGNVVEQLTGGQNVPLSWQAYVTRIEIKQKTGDWWYAEVTIRYYDDDMWNTWILTTGTTTKLANFGASGHQMGVRNN